MIRCGEQHHDDDHELEGRYETAADPVAKRHFHALWLLSKGLEIDEVAELCRCRRDGFTR